MTSYTQHDGVQYTFGAVTTSVTGFFSGLDVGSSIGIGVFLPAIVLLLINLPKFLHDLLKLYREYKNKPTESGPEDDN